MRFAVMIIAAAVIAAGSALPASAQDTAPAPAPPPAAGEPTPMPPGEPDAVDKSVEETNAAIDEAKKAAVEAIEKAREAFKKAVSAAKQNAGPAIDKAKEATIDALEKAKQATSEVLDKAKQATEEALDAAEGESKGPQPTTPEAEPVLTMAPPPRVISPLRRDTMLPPVVGIVNRLVGRGADTRLVAAAPAEEAPLTTASEERAPDEARHASAAPPTPAQCLSALDAAPEDLSACGPRFDHENDAVGLRREDR